MKTFIRKIIIRFIHEIYGYNSDIESVLRGSSENNLLYNRNICHNSVISHKAVLYPKYTLLESEVGDYSYVARNSIITKTKIGKFCSIGANFVCGWGIHPTSGISTSPMFYSTQKQNGVTLSETDKIQENEEIKIGNDVFIGMNVTVLDGVTIGNGAIVGAGCVVSKDVPPYAIVIGNPMRVLRYRFCEDVISELQSIEWWNWDISKLQLVERNFFNVEDFIDSLNAQKN